MADVLMQVIVQRVPVNRLGAAEQSCSKLTHERRSRPPVPGIIRGWLYDETLMTAGEPIIGPDVEDMPGMLRHLGGVRSARRMIVAV